MPDILIRGVRMPVACSDCPARVVSVCRWTNHFVDCYQVEKPDFCPISELPPHGDLIDKDKAMNAILGEPPEAHYPSWYAKIVNEIPAIVPSNKEESFDTREDRP